MRDADPPAFRATHVVVMPSRADCYALRESDAVAVAQERGSPLAPASVFLVGKTGLRSFWRSFP